MQTVTNKNTCEASILNGMVANSKQSNTRKRLRVTLNVCFLRVSFTFGTSLGESKTQITSSQNPAVREDTYIYTISACVEIFSV